MTSDLGSSSRYPDSSIVLLSCPIIYATITCIILATAQFVYTTVFCPYYLSPLRRISGPTDDLFLFGQTNKFLQASWIPHLFHSWSLRWPDSPFVRYLGFGNRECLVVNSLNAYKEILQTKSDFFVKPESTRQIAATIIGDGLPFAEGHEHRGRRAILGKLFTTLRVKGCVLIVQWKAEHLATSLRRQRDDSGEVEVETLLWKAVLDVISVKVLGEDLDHLGSTRSPLHDLFGRTMQQSHSSHIIHYFSSYLPLRRILPFRSNNSFIQDCQEVRQFIRSHVESRRLSSKSYETFVSKDLPDAIQLMIEQGVSAWTDGEIVEYALNLLVLGHDTTACSLVWATFCLAQYPQYQTYLRQELFSLSPNGSRNLSYANIDSLRFLNNFLREVLRVYCPVAYVPRITTSPVTIDQVPLPTGTTVQLCPAVLNLHPNIWGPDATIFNPHRWDNLQGEAANAYAFASFHNGTRACIGKQLSMMEMKVFILELISQFEIQPLTEKEIEFASPSFTLRPKDKLRVRLVDL